MSDPRVIRFADWFDRVKTTEEGVEFALCSKRDGETVPMYWFGAFWWWVQPLKLSDSEAVLLQGECSDEIHFRRWSRERARHDSKVIPINRGQAA